MAILNSDIAGQNVDEIIDAAGGDTLIPEGVYTAVIVEDEIKPTQSGGQSLNIKFVISVGEYRDTQLIKRLNIINANPTAQKIAYEELARISKAAGFATIPQNTDELKGKPMLIEVKTELAKPYTDKNGVDRSGRDKSVVGQAKPLLATGTAASGGEASAPATEGAAPKKAPWKKN